jgi:peptide/nickel transport system substrate-binding protein
VVSVCLGEEPDSLFIYRENSPAAQIIRQAVYDGPVDVINYRPDPVILSRLPGLENGDVFFQAVQVAPGEPLVNASGRISRLVKGVRYRPSGCHAADCVEVYQGSGPAELDQLVIDFRLLPGLRWSDGEPLTAGDSVFAYQLGWDLYGDRAPAKFSVTESYRRLSATRVRWRGVPGFQSPYHYQAYFFHPLPEHRWGDLNREQLLVSERTNRRPLGWGPFQLEEWDPGSHLILSANPHYRAWSGLDPAYDRVVFRFMEGTPEALQALAAGECELAAALDDWPSYHDRLEVLDQARELDLVFQEGGAWEQITFGTQPRDQRPAFFALPEARRAAALCINRPALIRVEPRAGQVAGTFVPADHPEAVREAGLYPYNPAAGKRLLEDAGWIDHDQDSRTPREARGIPGIPDGTSFVISLLVFQTQDESAGMEIIAEGLADCGIEVEITGMPSAELLAPGPEGPIFGRNFDLAQFAWSRGNYQLCSLFLSDEIPGPPPQQPRGWGGANAAGYSNPAYDQACWQSLTNLPDTEQAREGFQEAQVVFGEDLPALPLYFRRDLILTIPDFPALESGSFLPLWDLEAWE